MGAQPLPLLLPLPPLGEGGDGGLTAMDYPAGLEWINRAALIPTFPQRGKESFMGALPWLLLLPLPPLGEGGDGGLAAMDYPAGLEWINRAAPIPAFPQRGKE